ncbi:MAG: trans-aconitate 2-methyltransferase [Tepidisphaeraceae bacterium]
MPKWDPQQYLRFERERTQPCIDLVNRIEVDDVSYAVDLGCGPGNSTEVLARRFPAAKVLGLDNSPAMIERAKRDRPSISFDVADASTWTSDRPCDVILSNAVFQWIDRHAALLPRLLNQLRPGGVLAVQMPRNFQSPTHQILRRVATSPRFASTLTAREPYWVKSPADYYDLLAPIAASVEIWETEYIHAMPDHDAIIEWYRGTGMRPYLEALDADEQLAFVDAIKQQLVEAYPKQTDGRVLFPFLRIFFVARK